MPSYHSYSSFKIKLLASMSIKSPLTCCRCHVFTVLLSVFILMMPIVVDSSRETLFARLTTGIFYPLKPGRVGREHVENMCIMGSTCNVGGCQQAILSHQHHLHQHTFLPPIGMLRRCVSTGLTSPTSHVPNLFKLLEETPAPVTCGHPTNLSCLLWFFCKKNIP